MKRRALVIAGLALAGAVAGTVPAVAGSPAPAGLLTRSDTSGCIVIEPLQLAICIPRL